MPNTKHIVRLPDGTYARRASVSRTYSHALVAFDSADNQRGQLQGRINDLQRHLADLDGTDPDDTIRAYYDAKIFQLKVQQRAATGKWVALSWASTEALATARANERWVQKYTTVKVLPVEIVTGWPR